MPDTVILKNVHQHCDDKTGTVVLVKVGNYIFGGYTDQTWQGKNFTKVRKTTIAIDKIFEEMFASL